MGNQVTHIIGGAIIGATLTGLPYFITIYTSTTITAAIYNVGIYDESIILIGLSGIAIFSIIGAALGDFTKNRSAHLVPSMQLIEKNQKFPIIGVELERVTKNGSADLIPLIQIKEENQNFIIYSLDNFALISTIMHNDQEIFNQITSVVNFVYKESCKQILKLLFLETESSTLISQFETLFDRQVNQESEDNPGALISNVDNSRDSITSVDIIKYFLYTAQSLKYKMNSEIEEWSSVIAYSDLFSKDVEFLNIKNLSFKAMIRSDRESNQFLINIEMRNTYICPKQYISHQLSEHLRTIISIDQKNPLDFSLI